MRQTCLLILLLSAAVADAWQDAKGSSIRLAFAGDVMLDTLPGEAALRGEDIFAPIQEILARADVAVANLECAIGAVGRPVEGKPYAFRASPQVIPLLARHFQAVSVANNHTGDFGRDGFVETLQLLQGRVAAFGGGRNRVEAHRPLLVKRRGVCLALLGYNEFQPREFEAGPDTPGVAWSDDRDVVADIAAARAAGADFVVPFMHWGWEGEPRPSRRQRRLARRMIDAGADLVVGGHPHITQGAELYKGRLIVYSLGNFVFDGFSTVAGRTGWLLSVVLDRSGVTEWEILTVTLDDRGLPHPVAGGTVIRGRTTPRQARSQTWKPPVPKPLLF